MEVIESCNNIEAQLVREAGKSGNYYDLVRWRCIWTVQSILIQKFT